MFQRQKAKTINIVIKIAKAMVVVNSVMIKTYYKIGTIINKRKEWGNKYLNKLVNDLKEYNGMSLANLKSISLVAKTITQDEFNSQPVSQIPWATLLSIIHKSSSYDEILLYINYVYSNKLSRNETERSIKNGEYLLNITSNNNIPIQVNLPINMFKDTYIIDYPSIDKSKNEKIFTDKLLDNIICFLKDLREGFALVGKEYEILIEESTRK